MSCLTEEWGKVGAAWISDWIGSENGLILGVRWENDPRETKPMDLRPFSTADKSSLGFPFSGDNSSKALTSLSQKESPKGHKENVSFPQTSWIVLSNTTEVTITLCKTEDPIRFSMFFFTQTMPLPYNINNLFTKIKNNYIA